MPLVLIAFGVALLVSSIRGTLHQSDGNGLLDLLQKDFTGSNSFLPWILALVIVGSIGYVKQLQPVANAFIVLIIVVFLLAANKGGKDFFSSLASQVLNRQVTLGATQ